MRRLEGRTALITGASSGIGQAIAIRFAQEGANVAINYLHARDQAEETGARVAEAVKSARYTLVQGDVSKEDDVQRMMADTLSEF